MLLQPPTTNHWSPTSSSSQKHRPHCIQHPPTTNYKFLMALWISSSWAWQGKPWQLAWEQGEKGRRRNQTNLPWRVGGTICMHTDNVFHRATMQIAVRPNGTLDWLNKCNLHLCRTVSLNFLRLHFPAQTCAVTSLLVFLLLPLPLVFALLLLLLLLLLPFPCSPNFESQNTRQQGAPHLFLQFCL